MTHAPNPDLFKNYGEILRREDGVTLAVFATLAGAVLLLVAWFICGALVQGIGRWWKRTRADSQSQPPSARRTPNRNDHQFPLQPRS